MIDLFSIFTYGGIVLFSYKDKQSQISDVPVNDLIQNVLIENKGDTSLSHTSGIFGLQYCKNNEFSLIFVVSFSPMAIAQIAQVVYRKTLEDKLTYVGDLLTSVSTAFLNAFKGERKAPQDFQETFSAIRMDVENKFRLQPKVKAMPRFEETNRAKLGKTSAQEAAQQQQQQQQQTAAAAAASKDPTTPQEGLSDSAIQNKLKNLNLARRPGKAGSPAKKGASPAAAPTASPAKKTKENRVWLTTGNVSTGASTEHTEESVEEMDRLRKMVGRGQGDLHDIDTSEAKTGGIFSFFRSIGTGTAITAEMLEPALEQTRLHLIEKNVAAEVAQKLCNSLRDSLIGKNKGTFQGIASVINESLEKSLTQILTPGRNIDVLRDVHASRGRGLPYSIVFCGVNGVGKSTNLSKICYWLIENKIRVLIAACDTFRAGAVEQILQVNKPDLVLFVGDALAGNEASDQLSKFNKALEYVQHGSGQVRTIDGIVLTKFDTIDDKVGASISMTYQNGQPIVFVGTGQDYPDLKRLNVGAVVKALLA